MSILELLHAAYGTGYVPQKSTNGTVAPKNVQGTGTRNSSDGIPKFGIKGKQPLTQDTYEYHGEKGLTKEQVRIKSYNDVHRHEAAHLAAAGKYASSGIIIDFNGDGFAVGGHVNVKMPTLNRENPQETIEHAQTVIKSAEAPASFSELSDADKSVAASARSVLSQAIALKGKKLNYEA